LLDADTGRHPVTTVAVRTGRSIVAETTDKSWDGGGGRVGIVGIGRGSSDVGGDSDIVDRQSTSGTTVFSGGTCTSHVAFEGRSTLTCTGNLVTAIAFFTEFGTCDRVALSLAGSSADLGGHVVGVVFESNQGAGRAVISVTTLITLRHRGGVPVSSSGKDFGIAWSSTCLSRVARACRNAGTCR